MKKALSLILALGMCLSFIPITAMATDLSIELDKKNYDPGEKMVITFKNIPARGSGWWYATTYKTDLSGYNNGLTGQSLIGAHVAGDYVMENLNAPTIPGEYAIVLFNENEVIITSATYTVGMVAKDGHIALDKKAYTAMEQIVVNYSGITQQMVNQMAVVRFYHKNAPHDITTIGGGGDVKLGSGSFTTMAPNQNGEFEARLYSVYNVYNDETFVMSVPFTVSGAVNTSGWAKDQNVAEKAAQYGLIPDSLRGADWTKPITRAEFAAVSVKLYENLSGEKTVAVAANPFTDTKDPEILKAFNIGVTNGTSATLFSPDDLLNREQAATMLTRALKTAYIPGWTLATDGNYTLSYEMPPKFDDDDKISGWAKDSVYYMVANKIINGMGNNIFGPRNITERETAMNYANATREQALAIAVRMVENLKDKPLDYK